MTGKGEVAVDISRLLTGFRFAQPTGIERIELGLARYLSPDSGGVALTPIGARGFDAAGRRRIAKAADAHWSDRDTSIAGDLEPIARFLRGEPQEPQRLKKSWPVLWSLLPTLGRSAFRSPGAVIGKAGAYLHANFFRLEKPDYFEWLSSRPDIRPAFLLFDLLPIQYPQFFRDGEDRLHARRIETAARLGRVLITSCETVSEQLKRHLVDNSLPQPPIRCVSLPVDDVFRNPPQFDWGTGSAPYFVICGTIEPRKNHRLLLDAWEHLAKSSPNPPKLVIAGRRGWNNDAVFRRLDALEGLNGLVMEASSISTAALATLVRNAKAVLSPSISEGFGLPVAEALAAGTPVIAADTLVYRELWHHSAQLLDKDSPGLWADAIRAKLEATPPRALNRSAPHVMDWPTHVQHMEAVLDAA